MKELLLPHHQLQVSAKINPQPLYETCICDLRDWCRGNTPCISLSYTEKRILVVIWTTAGKESRILVSASHWADFELVQSIKKHHTLENMFPVLIIMSDSCDTAWYQTLWLLLLLTAFSRWVWASSLFFVCRYSTEPSWRWVRASTLGGGLNWNTACRQWTHRRIFGGLDVRKCSAKPSSARYQGSGASVLAAILSR